jgi:hypothetical protein
VRRPSFRGLIFDVMTRSEAGGGAAPPVPAPLGRYAHSEPRSDTAAQLHTVQLFNLPIALFLRTREHHDDLVREFTLMAIQRQHSEAPRISERLSDLVETLGRRYGASAGRADAVRDAAIERGDATVDLSYEVPDTIVADLIRLTELTDAADEFCRNEQLLTLPRSPEMVAFAHWYNGQFLDQIKGLPPTPWSGPVD